MPELVHELQLACSVESLFDFLSRPLNIIRLTPPESQLEFVAAPDIITPGAELEFEVRAFGQVQSVVHEIVVVDRPRRILERMVHGPLEDLEHEHTFEGNGCEARLIDRIRFEPPRGLIGLLLTEARLRTSFERSFEYRSRVLEELVAAGELQ